MGNLWTVLGGEGGRVSRGGASPELQARPSRAEAHEVVSGGSYSASKRTQIPMHASSSFWHHLTPTQPKFPKRLKIVWSACLSIPGH